MALTMGAVPYTPRIGINVQGNNYAKDVRGVSRLSVITAWSVL